MRIVVLGGFGPATSALNRALAALNLSAHRDGPIENADLLILDEADTGFDAAQALHRLVQTGLGNAEVMVITRRTGATLDALLSVGCTEFVRWPEDEPVLTARMASVARRFSRRPSRDEMAEKYDLLFHNELDAISLCDLGTARFIDVNEAWQKLYGYSRDEAVGRMGPKDVSAEASATNAAILQVQEGTPCKHVRWHRSRAGVVFPVEIFAGSYALGGRRVLVSMIRDITDRVRLETQLRQADRLASVGTLAAGVAHEINNPLAFVVNNLEYLHQTCEKHLAGTPLDVLAVRDAVTEARDGIWRVREIVRDLKSFSRVDEQATEAVDVAAVMDVSLRLLGNEIRHRAELRRDYEPGLFAQVNDGRLGQVFVNLLSNAVQALPERARARNVIQVGVREQDGEIVAEVRDNGPGIAPENLHRIFDPFFTTKPPGEGTGLGLAICQSLVNACGGRIEVQSRPGQGAAFRVHLPRAEGPARARAQAAVSPVTIPPPPAGATLSTRQKMRLLLIDDERNLGVVLGRALEPELEVAFVTDARDGLKRLKAGERFDAVVCDLMMPAMDGMQFYEELVQLDAGLARRTGFITGGTFTPPAREFAHRMNGRVIEKPFMAADLHALVRTLVSAG